MDTHLLGFTRPTRRHAGLEIALTDIVGDEVVVGVAGNNDP
jgi:hypothetical protein